MTLVAEALGTALIHSLWQDACVAGGLALAMLALRRSSPPIRYGLACGALALMTLLPALTAVLAFESAGPDAISPSSHMGFGLASPEAAAEPVRAGGPTTGPRLSWMSVLRAWLLPAWLAGVLACSLRLVFGLQRTLELIRRSEEPDPALIALLERLSARLHVTQRVRLILSSFHGPATMGWLRPVVLLPPSTVLGLTMDQLEAIVVHELAHVRRHDYAVNLAQMAVESLFFYHPAVWWVSARIRVERELCCDDVAAAACGDRMRYAQALAAVAHLQVDETAVASSGSHLRSRIERLLGVPDGAPMMSRWSMLFVIAAVTVGLAASGMAASQGSNGDTATLSGRTYDPWGEPLANVTITLDNNVIDETDRGPAGSSIFLETQTDSSGRFTFQRLAAGAYVLTPSISWARPVHVRVERPGGVEQDVWLAFETVETGIVVPDRPAPEAVLSEQRQRVAASLPTRGPEHLRPAAPRDYPDKLLHLGLPGTVVLTGHIDSDGAAKGVQVISAPHPDFARAALAAVRTERWHPARVRGQSIEVPLRITISYLQPRRAVQATVASAFEITSVKENRLREPLSNNWEIAGNRFNGRNSQVSQLIRLAWGDFQLRIEGAPDWLNNERYDVVGLAGGGVTLRSDSVDRMMRALLEDRFKLAAHLETRDLPIFALVPARPDRRPGPKLEPPMPDCALARGTAIAGSCGPGYAGVASGAIKYGNSSLANLALILSRMPVVGRPVIDETGLTGGFKIDLQFAPASPLSAAPPSVVPDGPDLFAALQEQLGLKLEPRSAPMRVLVIDRIERPSSD